MSRAHVLGVGTGATSHGNNMQEDKAKQLYEILKESPQVCYYFECRLRNDKVTTFDKEYVSNFLVDFMDYTPKMATYLASHYCNMLILDKKVELLDDQVTYKCTFMENQC